MKVSYAAASRDSELSLTMYGEMKNKEEQTMKKINFMLFAVAAIAAVSCAKEILPEDNQDGTNPEVELIPMSFTAGSETADVPESETAVKPQSVSTRAALQNDETTIWWQAGDQINVFDASGTVYEPFTTGEGGASVTFEGMAGKAEGYYALYPYQADAKMEGEFIYATLPNVQQAVEGSFDPKAFVSVAKSDANGNFSFKNVLALVKFTMPEGENASSVTLYPHKQNENLTGGLKISFDENGLPKQTYVSGKMHKTVTLKGDLKSGRTYYFVIRTGVPFEEGFTIAIDGRKYRTSNAKPPRTPVRNMVMNLPEFTVKEGLPKDLYMAYQLGFDLNIGGQRFDKATYGEATLIESAITAPQAGVYFLNPGIEQPIGSNISQMAIIGRYAGQRSVLTRSGLSYISGTTDANNYLILANVEYKVTNLGDNKYYLGVNNTDAFENLVFDNIKVELPNTISLATCSNDSNRALKNVVLMNSDIKVGASPAEATYTGATTTYLIKSDAATTADVNKDMTSVVIENNVIYSDGEVKRFRVFSAEKVDVPNLTMNNNTIVNCYQYNGYVASSSGAYKINEVKGNLFYIPSFGVMAQWYAIVYPKSEQGNTDPYKAVATEKFTDNHAYYSGGTLPAKYLRSMYGTGTNSPASLAAAPFTSEQIAAGDFALPEGTTYGAKRGPGDI